MNGRGIVLIAYATLSGCAADAVNEAPQDALADYEEVDATTILDAPSPTPGTFAPENLYQVQRGEYLVELLGCGACHTDGARSKGFPISTSRWPDRRSASPTTTR